MEKKINYEAALSEIEEIVNKMENDEFDIDQLSVNLKRAQTLIKLCRDKLTKTDAEIKKLLGTVSNPNTAYERRAFTLSLLTKKCTLLYPLLASSSIPNTSICLAIF